MDCKEFAHQMPESSGVYLMKDIKDEVIYVGKAKNLRRRVSSYFLTGRNAKTAALVAKIDHIEFVITGNEYEALVLENNLIKSYNPHYNILLKDGKTYPMIKITNEKFPRIYKTRRIVPDGARYYGPFPQVQELDTYLDMINSSMPIRLCTGPLKKRTVPCLYYHIHRCSGPCIGQVSEEEYNKYIQVVDGFLSGKDDSILTVLEKEMLKASKELDFEVAAKKRDLLQALKKLRYNQSVEEVSEDSRDYAAIEMRGNLCTVSLMQMRFGRLIGRALYRAESLDDETETLLSFLVQYYSDGKHLPQELFVSQEVDKELLVKYFSEELKVKVSVEFPQEGKHYRILRMASVTAARDVEKRMCEVDNTAALAQLQEYLDLEVLPSHIEGYDIAQLAGKYTVASLIVFKDGNPSKSEYRRFNIRSLEGKIDDFESMREAVTRRYTRVLNEKLALPNLVLVDGGKGQVSAARDMLDVLGLTELPVVGLAEENEEIVFSDDRPSLLLDHANPALRVLIAIRDECHRFATSANQRMRSKEVSFALLESIEGVGKSRSTSIMKQYESVENILALSPEELSKGAHIPIKVAERIINKLKL